jgi:protein tyrosine phosphatase (PTP) superfamily phosphohydrolase (DUF442 family)
MRHTLLYLVMTVGLITVLAHAQESSSPKGDAPNVTPQRVEAKHLPNAFRLHEKVISGGLPEGESAFKELQALGVKTVISVDGAKPDVALAKQFGLRYVHLPHGYDGVPEDRAKELAKAVRDLPGAVYIHCHHGKHRSPAAATVACVSTGLLKPQDALGVLKTAGTSENYRGLYQSAGDARRLDDKLLDELKADFPESIEVPPMAQAMVEIEHVHDHLKAIAKAGWHSPADHPDLDSAHETLLLREHFTELLRTEEIERQPNRFQELLRDSESAAGQLEDALRESPTATARATEAFDRITKACTSCHRDFRDIPLKEKKR